eukprot:691937-Amphidinium_carterae.1
MSACGWDALADEEALIAHTLEDGLTTQEGWADVAAEVSTTLGPEYTLGWEAVAEEESATLVVASHAVVQNTQDADTKPLHASASAKRGRGRPKKAIAKVVPASTQLVIAQGMSSSQVGQAMGFQAPFLHGSVDLPVQLQSAVSQNSLKVPTLSQYSRPMLNGFAMSPVTAGALLKCTELVGHGNIVQDQDYQSLAAFFVESGANFHCSSAVVLANQVNVSENVVGLKLCRLAACQHAMSRWLRGYLEAKIVAGIGKEGLLGYCEQHSYDETPMRTGFRGDKGMDTLHQVPVSGHGQQASQAVALGLDKLESSLVPQAMVCKLLQCQQTAGMVLKVGGSYA